MQLFDPACEGVYVGHVERKCSEIWDELSDEEQAIAHARVEVLHTLFASPDPKRTSVFEVLHERFSIDKFLVWYDSAKDLLDIEGPKSLARAAYKAGQDDSDEQLADAFRTKMERTREALNDVLTWLRERDDVPIELVERVEEASRDLRP